MNKEQIEQRMKEISTELESPAADVVALEAEYRSLKSELSKAELRKEITKQINDGAASAKGAEKDERKSETEHEKRGLALKEGRSVTVGASNILTPVHTGTTLAPTFNEVSSIVDLVSIEYMKGGESYKKAFVKGYGEGGLTREGEAYSETEPKYGYAEINKAKITAYTEVSEETSKLSATNYEANVSGGIKIALRKKMARMIMNGNGSTDFFKGIFFNPTDAKLQVIDPNKDLKIGAIDEKTLDEIIFSFGGEEDVEGDAYLILNKLDLKAFAMLRDKQGRKVYDIKKKGNTGTINEVPFIINSACKAISDSKTAVDDYSMAYGNLKNYTTAVFSDVEMQKSSDYKFKEGMLAFKGGIMAGGSVATCNGFIRVKKALIV